MGGCAGRGRFHASWAANPPLHVWVNLDRPDVEDQRVRETLERHPDTYAEVLADHFSRHLDALRLGM